MRRSYISQDIPVCSGGLAGWEVRRFYGRLQQTKPGSFPVGLQGQSKGQPDALVNAGYSMLPAQTRVCGRKLLKHFVESSRDTGAICHPHS